MIRYRKTSSYWFIFMIIKELDSIPSSRMIQIARWIYRNWSIMLDVLRSLKSLVKVGRVHIDNEVFRLHYTFTVLCLLTFCIVVTTKQYVGDPIDCVHGPDIPSSIINTYCWIHTTYTIPSAYSKKVSIISLFYYKNDFDKVCTIVLCRMLLLVYVFWLI